MNKLLLATEQGIVICERDGDNWQESSRGLKERDGTQSNGQLLIASLEWSRILPSITGVNAVAII